MPLPTVDVDEINSWSPCHDVLAYNDPDFSGNAIDVLNYTGCHLVNRLWVMCRPAMLPDDSPMHDFGRAMFVEVAGELTQGQLDIVDKKNQWIDGTLTDVELDSDYEAQGLVAAQAEEDEKAFRVSLSQEHEIEYEDDVNGYAKATLIERAIYRYLSQDGRTASYKVAMPLLEAGLVTDSFIVSKFIEILES